MNVRIFLGAAALPFALFSGAVSAATHIKIGETVPVPSSDSEVVTRDVHESEGSVGYGSNSADDGDKYGGVYLKVEEDACIKFRNLSSKVKVFYMHQKYSSYRAGIYTADIIQTGSQYRDAVMQTAASKNTKDNVDWHKVDAGELVILYDGTNQPNNFTVRMYIGNANYKECS